MDDTLSAALETLVRRIARGADFPAACWMAADQHKVDYTELAAEYDNLPSFGDN